jgi:hypothetical protein
MYVKFVIRADNKMAYQPARAQSSAMIIAAPGSRSEGLRMSVFPVAIAIGIDHSGIMLRYYFRKLLGMTLVGLLTQES